MSFQCPPGSRVYTIKPGDTLYRLAQTYGTTVNEILAANPGLDPNSLQVARIICIPGAQPETCPSGTSPYIIQRGDTLWALSLRFGTTISDILNANPGMNPYTLQIGRTICIPQPVACPGGRYYTIQPGDTLYLIATRFDVSFGSLTKSNPGLDPDVIYPGQIICIPPARPISCPGNNWYVIQTGENLSLIAEKFVVSATDILRLNSGLRPSEFTPGRTVCIPQRQAPV